MSRVIAQPKQAQFESALYVGTIRHRRFGQRSRSFRYSLFMLYLDLAELSEVFRSRWLWSTHRPALARFDRRDFFGDAQIPLDCAVRDAVEEASGSRPLGPIRMLAHLRYAGYCMNPVTFYYCFSRDGTRVQAILAEITNTPWGERRAHILHSGETSAQSRMHRFRFAKDFHVSPFMDMNYQYDWRFSEPGELLSVHMENQRAGKTLFDASLNLTRREISSANLAWALCRFPAMTARVALGIYSQALRLLCRGYTFYPHPDTQKRNGE